MIKSNFDKILKIIKKNTGISNSEIVKITNLNHNRINAILKTIFKFGKIIKITENQKSDNSPYVFYYYY